MRKEAFDWTTLLGRIDKGAETAWKAGENTYKQIDSTLWITAHILGALATAGAIHALNPKAVADNADKYIVNEALKTSLANSIRKQEMIKRQKETEAAYNDIRKHDRFV